MVSVYIADTGETVVIHGASGSVVVADDFDTAFVRLQEALGDDAQRQLRQPPSPADTPRHPYSWAHYGVLALLALLPFVWLGVLHVSLGGLIVGLRNELGGPGQADLGAQVQSLQKETEGLGRKVQTLTTAVAKLRKPRKKKKAPAAIAEPLPKNTKPPVVEGAPAVVAGEPPPAASEVLRAK